MMKEHTMSDQEKKETSLTSQPDAENKKQSAELSEEELKKVSGGAQSGEKWIEIQSTNYPTNP
jgi:bacteriocin-like protein